MPPPRRLAHAAGTFLAHPDRAPAEVRVDALGARAQSRAARGGRVAAALSLPALRAAGRRDGELRRRRRRGRAALRFLRRVPSPGSGAAPVECRQTARAGTRPESSAQDPAQLPRRGRMAPRTGRHALPASGVGARRRRAGAFLHLFDRLSGAVPSGSRPGISRLPPGSRRVRRHLRGSGSEASAAPGAQTVFSRPRTPSAPARFAALCRARGVRLDLRTRMLFREREFFVNGERVEPPGRLRRFLTRLADERVLPPGERLPGPLLGLLHDWYLAGWLRIGERHE